MERIKYSCANCGWETSVTAQWKDLKPKRCMNKKCNTSFRKDPDKLIAKDPTQVAKNLDKSNKKPTEVNKDDKNKKSASNKQKTSDKTEQQQEE